jgi:hypothetical protein
MKTLNKLLQDTEYELESGPLYELQYSERSLQDKYFYGYHRTRKTERFLSLLRKESPANFTFAARQTMAQDRKDVQLSLEEMIEYIKQFKAEQVKAISINDILNKTVWDYIDEDEESGKNKIEGLVVQFQPIIDGQVYYAKISRYHNKFEILSFRKDKYKII